MGKTKSLKTIDVILDGRSTRRSTTGIISLLKRMINLRDNRPNRNVIIKNVTEYREDKVSRR